MSDEEFDACYFNSRDFSCFRDRERRISRNFSTWGFMNGGRRSEYLGVESTLQRFHRRQRTKNAVSAVLLEQELREENRHDPEFQAEDDALVIAHVYQQHTIESARLARERANINGSQVERSASSAIYLNRRMMNDTKMEKREEENHIASKRFELPWEVPAFTQHIMDKNMRPADLIKYTTCSHPSLSRYYSDTSETVRYTYQGKFQGRGTHRGHKSHEAPVQQKIIRNREHNQSREDLSQKHTGFQLSQHPATPEYSYPGTVTQQWVWNPMPCDVVPPANVPGGLPWSVY